MINERYKEDKLLVCVNKFIREDGYSSPVKKTRFDGFIEFLNNENECEYSIKSQSKTSTIIEGIFYSLLPRCLASKGMTKLLDWRSVNTFNESASKIHKIANKVILGLKVLISEVAQPLLAACAAVETVAYGALFLKEYALGHDCTRAHLLLESSAFTLLWTPGVFCYYNLFCAKPPSDEFLLRDDLNKIKISVVEKVWRFFE
ncbi:MAG: hypothetical protein H0W50_03895 [Parachlamydiaceae bacterium]|nr:hypothetical protein [Parachlamydiaceae bacterium]